MKIQFSMPRKNVLLLSKVIEHGLAAKEGLDSDSILCVASKETLDELNAISDELLKKTGLIEKNEKLKTF